MASTAVTEAGTQPQKDGETPPSFVLLSLVLPVINHIVYYLKGTFLRLLCTLGC